MKKRDIILTIISISVLILFLMFANSRFDSYQIRILNLCAIYTILGLSMNLINGFTGLFSLGHAGFMAIGAYVTALLTMPAAVKNQNFFLQPIVPWLENVTVPFLPALLIGGIMAAILAFIIGAPVLRLRGDYLAIATLGFSEIIRIVFTNTQNITNGALGLKSIPNTTNLWWSFGLAALTIIFMLSLINSSYGKALKAIREDEIAAESMGIGLFRHKMLAFVIGAFFAGVGGGLLGNLLGAINPVMFRFILTFNVLLIIVLGGMGSITGTVISAFVVTSGLEYLRVLDESINLGFVRLPGIPGLRMVVFSSLLMIVVIFFRNGLMGTNEFSWDGLFALLRKRPSFLKREVGR
ncbi:branched-chain amino acid ABC transporter permease [Alkaliphilus peptidifermentans]|uniref:Amino acid/amide ABC transporter membrane protein 2, HAAT family n=1 Tax=Alkaliphilus peptidifermentans DSM 18978 TaxID=1120976 RepID=A0A1G5JDX4_9FIRM|nr:branched-chain amino acid ABC transporter permease [Alkaliphilus peptidifermentans]SCY86542.1 amino acid/amide ABC transporter membrane protein 2, HAAT family [Alkaliphilus peptidifermentans DSM 18978]